MKRFFHALRDVVLGVRVGRDHPVAKYKVELERASERNRIQRERQLHSLEFQAKQDEQNTRNKRERLLRRIKAARKHSGEVLKRAESELEEKHSLRVVARRERERSEERFEAWHAALGRPPYKMEHRSMIDRLRFKLEPMQGSEGGLASMASTIDTETLSPRWRRAISIGAGVVGVLVIPFDIVYSLPGFEVLLEDPFFARMAAILLGIILFSLGSTLSYLITRVRSRHLLEDGKIGSSYSGLYAVLIVLVTLLSLTTIYGATTVRSIVPEANTLLAEQRMLSTRISSLEQRNRGGRTVEDRAEEISLLREQAGSIREQLSELRHVTYPVVSADAVIAFSFYFFAVVSVMVSKVSRHDPVFEYQLAAQSYSAALNTEVRIVNGISSGRAKAEAIIADLDVNIEDQEQELKDEVGPSKKIEAQIQDMKFAMQAAEADDSARIKREALTYAKSLKFLTWNPKALREWEEIFDHEDDTDHDLHNQPLTNAA